ncbi:MAG: glycosyltransferase family 2 protein [Candidatus Omnitrophota bacterium]|nr:glycosyltransferase family 2 protein [Candidatus Omnitrophota bacterium]
MPPLDIEVDNHPENELTGADTTKPYVSVVLPAFNEEEAIATVIDSVRNALKGTSHTYELLVVDDCSDDKTVEIAASKGVKVIRRRMRGGSGSSRRTGIRESQGAIIVMLDADGSYEAGDIPRLLEYFPEYDQVNGARTSEQGTLKLLRTPAKWIIRKLACYLTSQNIPDLNTGLKAFKKDIMKKYLWVLPDGFSCVTTMTLAFLANGFAVKYIPTTYHKRIGKSKFHPVKDTASYLNTVVRMVMYFKPLRVFMPLAFGLLAFGLIKSVLSLVYTSTIQESDIIIIMTAVLLGAVGLLADLIVAYQNRD